MPHRTLICEQVRRRALCPFGGGISAFWRRMDAQSAGPHPHKLRHPVFSTPTLAPLVAMFPPSLTRCVWRETLSAHARGARSPRSRDFTSYPPCCAGLFPACTYSVVPSPVFYLLGGISCPHRASSLLLACVVCLPENNLNQRCWFLRMGSRYLYQVLQEERVLRKVDVGDYPLDLVPLEKDVLSLELEGLFRRVRKMK